MLSRETGRAVDALAALGRGELVVGVDDAAQSCDLLVLAAGATTADLAVMIRLGSGFVCVTVDSETATRLWLPPMNWSGPADAFSGRMGVAVDAIDGTTTGISAHDRATTARTMCDGSARADSFTRPGHVIPVLVPDGVEPGHRTWLIAAAGRLSAPNPVPNSTASAAVVFSSLVSRHDPCRIARPAEAHEFGRPVLPYSTLTTVAADVRPL